MCRAAGVDGTKSLLERSMKMEKRKYAHELVPLDESKDAEWRLLYHAARCWGFWQGAQPGVAPESKRGHLMQMAQAEYELTLLWRALMLGANAEVVSIQLDAATVSPEFVEITAAKLLGNADIDPGRIMPYGVEK